MPRSVLTRLVPGAPRAWSRALENAKLAVNRRAEVYGPDVEARWVGHTPVAFVELPTGKGRY